jgi:hypothetical protein
MAGPDLDSQRDGTRARGGPVSDVDERRGADHMNNSRGKSRQADVLADKDPTFKRGNFCNVIRGSAWLARRGFSHAVMNSGRYAMYRVLAMVSERHLHQ